MTSRRSAARILALACCRLAGTPHFAAELSSSEWKQDLDFLSRELPAKHINLFFQLSRRDWEREVQRLEESLPSMSDVQVRTALRRLVASVGNAHTSIDSYHDSLVYPLWFTQFPEGMYVVAANHKYAQAIGARLTGINGRFWEDVVQRLLPLIPRENELIPGERLPKLLQTADALVGTGIASDSGPATFWFEKNGAKFSLEVTASPASQPGIIENRPEGSTYESPLYLTDRKTLYWFRYLEQARALYIQYNACQQMQSLSFSDFTRQVMEVADGHVVDKVIIDLRHNGGGNSEVINPLMLALKNRANLRREGHLFALTSHYTFSSGLINTLRLQKQLHALIAGQPSSQSLNSYGDIKSFKLPASGLEVWYCTKFFKLMPGRQLLEPDIPISLTARDYFSGRDAVLESVLSR